MTGQPLLGALPFDVTRPTALMRPDHVRFAETLPMRAGEAGAVMMTEMRGASNEKAKRDLGWQPRHASWRQGFAQAAA